MGKLGSSWVYGVYVVCEFVGFMVFAMFVGFAEPLGFKVFM